MDVEKSCCLKQTLTAEACTRAKRKTEFHRRKTWMQLRLSVDGSAGGNRDCVYCSRGRVLCTACCRAPGAALPGGTPGLAEERSASLRAEIYTATPASANSRPTYQAAAAAGGSTELFGVSSFAHCFEQSLAIAAICNLTKKDSFVPAGFSGRQR